MLSTCHDTKKARDKAISGPCATCWISNFSNRFTREGHCYDGIAPGQENRAFTRISVLVRVLPFHQFTTHTDDGVILEVEDKSTSLALVLLKGSKHVGDR